MRWKRPSLAGRRVALDRKFGANIDHYGGAVMLVTLTPPGEDLLPFGDESRVIDQEDVQLVEWIYREIWNATAQARASRLLEAAQRAADRFVGSQGWSGQLPRQIANVRAEQKRGVWHFHFLLPMGSPVERLWSRTVVAFMDRSWRRDRERWPDERERRLLVEREFAGHVTRGFYGFGFVHKGKQQGRSSEKAARYMARNAAGYMASNVAGSGRHYVSSRLTRETGVTMAALRACNWLHVRRKLIDQGELVDDWIPFHWSDEHRAEVLRVWDLVTARGSPDPVASPSH